MNLTTSYGYDLNGNVVEKTLPNGEKVAQSFDALNRVVTIEGQKPSGGGLLYRYAHRYDLAGNVVHIREDYHQPTPAKWREITQGYDAAHRLIWEQYRYSAGGILGASDSNRNVLYTYDGADNRTSKEIHYFSPDREEYSYNALNQLTQRVVNRPARPAQTASSGTVEYNYDLNGNRISRAEEAGVTGYEYDYEQRLIGVTNSTLQPAYAYTYDYRTRRVRIVATPEVGSATTTALSFSGGTSVQEYVGGTLDVEFIRGSDMGGGIGGILYSLRGGVASFTHYNNRGDVVAKTDTDSTLTYQAAYEAYGTRSEEAGSTLDPQKANTKDEDPTGLLNEGFRYRDLETGEFITRDPLGFVDGPNLYTYVRQNPWTKFDPEGLELSYRNPDVKNVIERMRKVDKRLDMMVKDLEKSRHVHTVDKLDQGNLERVGLERMNKGVVRPVTGNFKEDKNQINGTGVGTEIYINIDPKKYSGTGVATSPAAQATAAHELQHARDYDRGEAAKEPDPSSTYGELRDKVNPKTGLNLSEERAVRTQNIWQEKSGFQPRKAYGDKPVENPESKHSPLNDVTDPAERPKPEPTARPEPKKNPQKPTDEAR